MVRLFKKILYLSFSLLISFPLCAQNELLTLTDAMEYAYQHNPGLKQMEARIQGAKNLPGTVTGLLPPEVSWFREGMNGDANAPFAEQRLSFTQSVESPFALGSRLKMAKMETDLLKLDMQEYRKELRVEVKTAYIEVLYARFKLDLRKLQHKLAKDLYQAVSLRAESGMATGLDLLNAELQVAQAENELDAANKSFLETRYTLFKMMGLPPEEQKYSINFTDTLRIRDDKIDQNEAIRAIAQYPSYIRSGMAAEQKKVYARSLQRDLIPEIFVSYYRQDYGQGFHFNGVETGARIPLWYPVDQKSKVKIARAETDELLFRQQEVLLKLKEEIEHAWHSYDEYGKMVTRFKETIALRSERLQTLTLEAYKIGEIDLLNLLNAQRIYLNSREQYLNALHEYYIQAVRLEKFLPEEIVY